MPPPPSYTTSRHTTFRWHQIQVLQGASTPYGTNLAFCKGAQPNAAPNASYVRIHGQKPTSDRPPGLQNSDLVSSLLVHTYRMPIWCHGEPTGLTKLEFGAGLRHFPSPTQPRLSAPPKRVAPSSKRAPLPAAQPAKRSTPSFLSSARYSQLSREAASVPAQQPVTMASQLFQPPL